MTGAETIDWHTLGWAAFAFVCLMVVLVLCAPADAYVDRSKDDDDKDPPPIFPPF